MRTSGLAILPAATARNGWQGSAEYQRRSVPANTAPSARDASSRQTLRPRTSPRRRANRDLPPPGSPTRSSGRNRTVVRPTRKGEKKKKKREEEVGRERKT